MIDDALELGIHHATLNVDLTRLIEPQPHDEDQNPRWSSQGREFAFNRAAVARYDSQVRALSEAGVVVYLILLPYHSGDAERDRRMLHPDYDRHAPRAGPIGMFRVTDAEGRAWLRATVEFLADRYGGGHPDRGSVWGYIVGNEVNSHWFWANMGCADPDEVVDTYERAVRTVHQAVRTASPAARVYLSLDHHWTERYAAGSAEQAMPGRDLLDAFARLSRRRGDFDWHLAHHPYPESLGECRFWLDGPRAAHHRDSPLVTFKNLPVLLDYLDQPPLHRQGAPRRVILSEQGFHCADRPEGERDQAAAYALAYTLVERLDGIDAFILHRHVDHAREGGLRLGLWTRRPDSIADPDRQRLIHEVFRAAGTPHQQAAFQFALPVIGADDWNQALELLSQ